MRILFILVLLLSIALARNIGAESYPPSPSSVDSIAKPENRTGNNDKNSDKDKLITKSFPAIIEISKAPVIQIEATDKTDKKRNYSSSEWWMVYITFLLSIITGALAIYTGKLYRATVNLGRNADAAGKQQMEGVQKSIAEATRAATAMELISRHMEISAKSSTESVAALKERTALQMRAYLSVSIGNGIFQDRDNNLRFDVRPTLENSGSTPAHKITYWAKAEILPVPLPDNFQFTSIEDSIQSSFVLGPHQIITLNAIVDNYFPDNEVENIKRGSERRPYIWGIVSYTDVFGDSHITKFCHSIYWFIGPDGREMIGGNYTAHHNEAT